MVYVDQEIDRLTAEGMSYLKLIEGRLGGVTVERAMRFGDPVPEILREAEEFAADLIVVTTVSRSGIGRVLLGSVAEQILRKASGAVVLLRPAGTT